MATTANIDVYGVQAALKELNDIDRKIRRQVSSSFPLHPGGGGVKGVRFFFGGGGMRWGGVVFLGSLHVNPPPTPHLKPAYVDKWELA